MYIKNEDIDVLFLIFLSIMSSFTFKILSCPMQKILSKNVIVRNVLYLLLILFTTTFLSDNKMNPIYHFIKSFFIYLFIIVSTKMKVNISIYLFIIVMSLYIMHQYIIYFNYKQTESNTNNKLQYQKYNNILKKCNNVLIILAGIITIYGSVDFIIEKKNQYGKKFNLFKFLFGIRNCRYNIS